MGTIGRRGFLQALGAATTAALAIDIDPERLLWVTGKKSFLIPESPAPKNVISDPGVIKAEFANVVRRAEADGLKTVVTGYSVDTAVGRAQFDTHWNLLSLNGRRITSAREAADLQARHYTSYGDRGPNFSARVARVAAARAAAGIRDEVDRSILRVDYRAGWHDRY